jgi:hypothetical protein
MRKLFLPDREEVSSRWKLFLPWEPSVPEAADLPVAAFDLLEEQQANPRG